MRILDETKRRLSESEIPDIVWRDCTMNLLLSIKGCYVQAGQLLEAHCDLLYPCDLDCEHCYLDDKVRLARAKRRIRTRELLEFPASHRPRSKLDNRGGGV